MSHPDDETLVDLAINGTDAADVASSVSDHVLSCAVCSATVTDLRRTLSFASTSATDAAWVAPPASVWERITAQIDRPSTVATVSETKPTAADLPPSSASGGGGPRPSSRTGPGYLQSGPTGPIDRPTPLESRRDRRERESSRRPGRVGWAAGIAAAGLVVGLLTGRAVWDNPAPPPAATQTTSPVTTVSQATLSTLDANDPKRMGEAAVVSTAHGFELTIDTTKPVDAGDGYLEVWLINRDLKRMVSVGVLRDNGTAAFPISQSLIDQGYVVVDISLEQYDDNSVHSGDSVMRGKLPA
ncbi:MAG: anti-sigma factor [Humibacillus sp.]|nr:anti-sigma factor [Humibacillus sp.]MDN5779200.1 anti-sigma factor [Humibacillus sp.]